MSMQAPPGSALKVIETEFFFQLLVAQLMIDQGYATRSDYVLQMLNELPYAVWRNYDPEDTIRFYGLRMHELGMIKSPPQKIIAEHTDWRFLNELKRELKM
jgi:NitT/TauT family transport system substrate-binding protein